MENENKETTPYLAFLKPNTNLITLTGDRKEILRIENNGDIFVHGKLTENDKEVVDALREFLRLQKLI